MRNYLLIDLPIQQGFGLRLVRKACDERLCWIVENAGLEGFNAATDVYGDLADQEPEAAGHGHSQGPGGHSH